jgi:hypothetical protein
MHSISLSHTHIYTHKKRNKYIYIFLLGGYILGCGVLSNVVRSTYRIARITKRRQCHSHVVEGTFIHPEKVHLSKKGFYSSISYSLLSSQSSNISVTPVGCSVVLVCVHLSLEKKKKKQKLKKEQKNKRNGRFI